MQSSLPAGRINEETTPLATPGSSRERELINPPRPTLQKLSKENDIESYLDIFERVAGQQGWPNETSWQRRSPRCIRFSPHGAGSQLWSSERSYLGEVPGEC